MRKMLLALALGVCAAPAAADLPAGFDAHVDAVIKQSGAVGAAIAVVENGQVKLAKGYGVRKLGSPEKVDADTLFMIGSTGKAFTTAALAMLVDAGKLSWDDRVVDRLPGFQMYDPWVTREMTVKDLLVHRSGLGLGAGDLLMVPRGSYSREEFVRRLRYIKPATSFRSAYAYDNILYTVAGRLIEVMTGEHWEEYMRDHVFRPAGLPDATADMATQLSRPDRAFPHARVGGPVRGGGPQTLLDERDRLGQAAAPAGLTAMSANDLARWLQIQLGHGAIPGGGRLFSEASGKMMWTPVTPIPIDAAPPGMEDMQPQFDNYALGWIVRDYRGHKIVWHSGGLFGFTTVVVLIPEKNVGFSIELNSEDAAPRFGLMYELLDHYLGLPYEDWPAKFAALSKQRVAAAEAVVAKAAASPAKVGPSLSLDRYAGNYSDDWYGNMTVGHDDRGLTIDFKPTPRMIGRLEHYQYDTFIARFDDKNIEPAYVTFGLDADGHVSRITMKPVSPLADFSFDYQDLMFKPVPAQGSTAP